MAHIARRGNALFAPVEAAYLKRMEAFATIEPLQFRSEEALFEHAQRQRARTPLHLVLLDSRGRQFTSEKFAGWLGAIRDSGQQTVLFAVGPADGWHDDRRREAQTLLSLGPMTLPHELA
ncbi:MAG TPA: 23S rRNA (pseudouridine(1915)-N(3))-methyltransferase RlmH, partial [Acidobacteriaceae bacterium]|nr:23S rRNA (pseudouridine(1915)-N(3))-methyltransferase RlmH [Acidobacteriaceae bacterium]